MRTRATNQHTDRDERDDKPRRDESDQEQRRHAYEQGAQQLRNRLGQQIVNVVLVLYVLGLPTTLGVLRVSAQRSGTGSACRRRPCLGEAVQNTTDGRDVKEGDRGVEDIGHQAIVQVLARVHTGQRGQHW